MAHSGKLTHWLTESASRLNLEVTELSWARDWGLDLFDLEVSLEIEGRAFRGRGTAAEEELAFVKAGAEAIERAFCTGHGIHSVGVAAHTEEDLAKSGALKELFERDAFFSHFFTRSPFLPIQTPPRLQERFSGVFSAARSALISLRFFHARSSAQAVVISVAEGTQARPPFGGIIGLGCETTEEAAIESAFLEGARNVAASLVGGARPPLRLSDFSKILEPTSEDRQRLALDPSYWSKVEHLFPQSSSLPSMESSNSTEPIFERLSSPYRVLDSAPLFVYRAKFLNPFRPSERSPTTFARLEDFVGRTLTEAQLETLPHFLG